MPRPSVVFAAGQLLTHACWAPQVEALSPDYDLRFSDHTRDETIAGMAARLLAEAPPRFHLVAHAMGGFTAFEVMRQAPERVISLVLIATLAPNDGPAQTERRLGYIRLVEGGQFGGVVEERIPILVHPARREDEPLLTVVRRMAADTGADTFLRQQRAIMSRADSRPSLGAIRVPTLVIRGAQDGITTQAHLDEIMAGIPGARLAVVDDCGHLPTLEKPVTTNRILADWLASYAV
ncbi:MAG: alpha/beta hydrolase [Alphaproteobacteria bacterium]|nr:alpha/beta hydrolase [Alphaproteobacteria bacterium]MBU1516077.1 alpha/beta hydrolase [Alphaproteobacteria bacterium]MBU2092708.1 alpha/beta hydrolase [Alphaproteobacteria bacterium]MBU2153767.1 alpha/beta hydrolase [Alphaproteobacteria bacterium]MBU2308395.1 alpha/beta hydrolase [Alphaproteobacteria bacterium]